MRIAYVNFSKYPARNIEKKIEAMARGAQAAGISNFDFFYINGEKSIDSGLVQYVRFPKRYLFLKYYDFLIRRYKVITQSLDIGKYDFVVLRYNGADPTGPDFFKTYPVISEHHTLEIPEHQSNLNAGLPFPEHFLKKIRLKLEQKYGGEMLGCAKGIIGVTDEIRDYESARVVGTVPVVTIPNGITVSEIPKTGFKQFDGKHLDLAILAGGLAPWHGIDRLIDSIKPYKGSVKILLHVIGRVSRSNFPAPPDHLELHFHGYKTGKDLDDLLCEMNIGIGTLCLFRNGMKEACALKTREYMARGLPFVVAYKDSDLDHCDNAQPFFMPFENDDSLMDVEDLIEFADKTSRIPNLSDAMRGYAETHMDWRQKMLKYSNFIEHLKKKEGQNEDH